MFNEVLSKLLGIERLEGGTIDRWSIHWTNLGSPFHVLLFILAFAAACYGVWWFYRREPDYCSEKKRKILAVLRAAGVLVLLTILAGPVLQIEKSGVAKSKVAILVDVSKSMTRQDKYVEDHDKLVAAQTLNLVPLDETNARNLPPSAEEAIKQTNRIDLVRALFKHPEIDLLGRLRKEYDVEVRTFSNLLENNVPSLAANDELRPAVLDEIPADGLSTDMGSSLRKAMKDLQGQPLAGVILITDGANNRGPEPTLVAGDLPVRVYPVGIGVPEAKDVSVAHIFMERKIFVDDPAPIHVRIRHNGFSDEQVHIVVTMDGEELARQPVTLKKGGEQSEVVRIKPKQAGKFPIKVEIPAPEGDSEPGNNLKETQVEVIDEKIKVLILESGPRWEYRYLSTALLRDKRVECKILLRVPDLPELARPGSPYIKEFPEREDLFDYDVIVFGNMSNDTFWTEEQVENVRRFVVQEGGGIWFIAGKNKFPDTYMDSKLKDLIPVEFEPQPEITAEDERSETIREGFRVVLTPDGRTHSLTRLDTGAGGSDADNEGLWEVMPEMYWYHRAIRAKLGAIVLLVHGGEGETAGREMPPPILVTQQAGRGRVLYSAADQFWRMRYPAELGPDALERFYGHTVQHLGLAHALGGSPRIQISTDAEEYAIGDPVKITAHILDKDTYDPSKAKSFEAVAFDLGNDANEEEFTLTPIEGQPGMFRGELRARLEGNFRIRLKDELEEEGAYADYSVRTPQVEMDQPDMKKELLDNMAKASVRGPTEVKARMYYANQAGEIVKDLKESQRRLEIKIEDPLWDAPLFLLMFTVLMGAEWFIRKRSDLC